MNMWAQRDMRGMGARFSSSRRKGSARRRPRRPPPLLKGAEVLLSSPYTRALETAAILSRRLDMDIVTELDLHEWVPDFSYSNTTGQASIRAYELCAANRGVCPPDAPVQYEELEAIFHRAKDCLLKYTRYKKIIVVFHGVVIRQFTKEETPHCAVVPVEFSTDSAWQGFLGRI